MSPDEFRKHGHAMVEWIARFMENPERFPVLARVAPGDVRNALPDAAPETAEDFEAIMADFDRILMPGMTHWSHPGFMAYFSITASAPGVLADFVASALNQQAMLWRTSPSATELEAVVMGWLRRLIGLPGTFEGVIYDTASISSLHAIAAAREAAVPHVRTLGLPGRADVPRLRVYCSDQAHSSIEKGVILAGLGQEGLRKIPSDADYRMRVEALRAAIAEDRAAGVLPIAVVATVGTTSTTSVDPVAAIADVCEAEGLWLHIDSAYAGVAAMLPEHAHILAGAGARTRCGEPAQVAVHREAADRLDLRVPADADRRGPDRFLAGRPAPSHRPAFARKHLLDRQRVERVDVEGLREADVLVQAFHPERRGAPDDLRGGGAGGRVVACRGHRRPRPGKRDEPDAILGLEAIDESAGRFHGAARVEIPEAALVDGQEDEPSIGSRRRDPLVRAVRRDDRPRLDRLRRDWSVERRELHELGRDDPPRLPVDGDLELLRPKVRDRVPVLVHDGDINRDELDAGPEDGLLRTRSRLSARRRLRPARLARGDSRGAGRHDNRQHETGQRRGPQGAPSAHVTTPRARPRPCADASCGAARARRAP